MQKPEVSGLTGVLWAFLAGLISFTVGALVAGYLNALTDNFLTVAVGTGLGGLLLGLMLNMKRKLPLFVLICILAFPLGILSSFLLAGSVELIFPDAQPSVLIDILSITFMGLIIGLVSGLALYGVRAAGLFAIVTGLVATPFGYLITLFHSGAPFTDQVQNLVKPLGITDLNLLAILIGLGCGLGLSIGLYRMKKRDTYIENPRRSVAHR